MTDTMHAVAIEEFGDPEVFEDREFDRPDPGPEEALVRVEASSVNPVEYKIRAGDLPPFAPDFPAVLGCDAAGVVEAVGDDVTAFEAGDEVYGMVGGVTGAQGAYAEYVPAHADLLAPVPESLSFAEAAALPVVGLTAWEMLVDKADAGEGDSTLVYGGAGGVGHVGVQLADWLGADVYATGSTERKREFAADLGASATIDYTATDTEEYVAEYAGGEGFDVVFDPVGDDHLPTAFEAVAPFERVVTTESSSRQDLSAMHQKALSLGVVLVILPVLRGQGRERVGERLRRINEVVEDGGLEPVLDDERFELTAAGVADAHRYAEAGDHVGKISLVSER
ncbi:zinc-binding dehydrogenase [Halorussus limi]|uniref:Zinc-binding dehydrogenase n=1 Tax=Halorussus limi TaxID=2938695 RepID=A0A8U0HQW3_9EURY|nr:zinc-binding dehydrogenase [Halorussus limi]UPV73126.1 zinc-binding dehydrogenase [Halorussus limi]